jgi:hypothetical protein
MRTLKNSVAVGLASVLLFGCATLQQAEKWGKIAQIAARRGTYETVKARPDARAVFATVAATLDSLLIKPSMDSAEIIAALQQLKVKELKGDQGALLIGDVIDVVDIVGGDSVRLKDDSRLRPVVTGIVTGIREGLSLVQ